MSLSLPAFVWYVAIFAVLGTLGLDLYRKHKRDKMFREKKENEEKSKERKQLEGIMLDHVRYINDAIASGIHIRIHVNQFAVDIKGQILFIVDVYEGANQTPLYRYDSRNNVCASEFLQRVKGMFGIQGIGMGYTSFSMNTPAME